MTCGKLNLCSNVLEALVNFSKHNWLFLLDINIVQSKISRKSFQLDNLSKYAPKYFARAALMKVAAKTKLCCYLKDFLLKKLRLIRNLWKLHFLLNSIFIYLKLFLTHYQILNLLMKLQYYYYYCYL